jgi:arylsulfatase A-like enzyme
MKKLFLFAWLLAAATVAACSPQAQDPPAAALPNLILVSVDTLRPDHLGCYGYDRPTSPNLDEFRKDAVLFSQAIAPASSTLPSHASMLTSLLPQHHGASWARKTRMADAALSIAEVLREEGFRTAAFTGGGQMDRAFRLDQGFDLYEQPPVMAFSETVDHAIEWLRQGDTGPFFLFLHSYETHHPYSPTPENLSLFEPSYEGPLPDVISVEYLRELNQGWLELANTDLLHIVNAYDGEIRSMDEGFGKLLSLLEEADLYDSTLVVFTSDHGEEFGEHGKVGWHSHTLYDELLRVPLLIKLPHQNLAGATVDEQVRLIDIAPTALAALGLEIPESYLGIDLVALIGDSGAGDLAAVSRIDRKRDHLTTSVRTQRWKLAKKSLFDLENDPDEQWDVAFGYPEVVAELKELESKLLAEGPILQTSEAELSDESLIELKALGYLR